MEAESPVDDHENLAKNSWHPSNKAARVTELDEDMRDVNDDLDKAEHELYTERAYRDLNDDKKEIATLGKQSSNDHCTREEVQHNENEDLMEESLQTSKKLVNDSNTGADTL